MTRLLDVDDPKQVLPVRSAGHGQPISPAPVGLLWRRPILLMRSSRLPQTGRKHGPETKRVPYRRPRFHETRRRKHAFRALQFLYKNPSYLR